MGEVTAVVMWGKRHLAYPIEKQTSGYYVVAQFTARPDPLTELERVLKLEDDLLRYLVVLREGDLPLPDSAVQRTGEDSAGDTSNAIPTEEGGEVLGEEDEAEKENDVDEVLEDVTDEED